MRIRAAAPGRGASSKGSRLKPRKARGMRRDASPYTKNPGLQRINIALIAKYIRKNPGKFKTDKFTLLEIADRVLAQEIDMPRPAKLKAHMIFQMLLKPGSRIRKGVSTPCLEWRGAVRSGAPVLTTVNSMSGKRLIVDARKYILENPAKGKRRNFRSNPHSLCGNDLCVNPRHIEMRGMPHELKSGENHARAKYPDKLIRKMAHEYNAGATAKELAKKYRMVFTYVEQIMRKERRTEATEGMTIRGRFHDH